MNDVLFKVLEIVIIIAITVIMRYVVPILKLKITSFGGDELWKFIVKAVQSAEQTIKGAKKGTIKKEEVLSMVTAWANEHNIPITQEQLSSLIESAVYAMNSEKES